MLHQSGFFNYKDSYRDSGVNPGDWQMGMFLVLALFHIYPQQDHVSCQVYDTAGRKEGFFALSFRDDTWNDTGINPNTGISSRPKTLMVIHVGKRLRPPVTLGS